MLLIVATIVAVRRGHGGLGALLGVARAASRSARSPAEALVALTVRLAAPGASDFNEYRWVFLAPWGRLGLALGGAAVVGIVALSWRASRGAPRVAARDDDRPARRRRGRPRWSCSSSPPSSCARSRASPTGSRS